MIKYVKASPDANGFMTDEELDAYVSEQKAKRDSFYSEQERTANRENRGDRIARASAKRTKAIQDEKDRKASAYNSYKSTVLQICQDIEPIALGILEMCVAVPELSRFIKPPFEYDRYAGKTPHLDLKLDDSMIDAGISDDNYRVIFWVNKDFGFYYTYHDFYVTDQKDDMIPAEEGNYNKIIAFLRSAKQIAISIENEMDKALDEYLVDED